MDFTKEDLKEAQRQISSMKSKIKKAQSHLKKGTPQWSLARNRQKALRVVSELIKKDLR